MTDRSWTDLAAPVPDMVASSRRHLAERYATGIYRLLWEQEKRPIPDAHAVRAVVSAAAAERRVDVLDIGAALVIVQAMRLELDLLEADVFDVAEAGGVPDESVAAVLELPGAAAVTARHQMLSAKRELLRSVPEESVPVRHPEDAREAAGRAARRAASAASRATEAGRRRERLRRNHDLHAGPTARGSGPEDTEMVSARASEARINSRDANERVALSLLRAADTLDKSAKRYQEQERRTADRRAREQFRRRATEYAQTAELYRKLADHYLRLGEGTR
jgi:hypothetical protein